MRNCIQIPDAMAVEQSLPPTHICDQIYCKAFEDMGVYSLGKYFCSTPCETDACRLLTFSNQTKDTNTQSDKRA